MKEKIYKKLKELATKSVRRVDWSGERWFVRRYKQGLALGWIAYFLLEKAGEGNFSDQLVTI